MAERKPRSWPSILGTQKERATEAFRRLEDMTRLISDWVWETDAGGKLTYVSERIIDRLGMHPVQVVGKRLSEIGTFISQGGTSEAEPQLMRPFRDAGFEAAGHDGKLRHFAVSGLPRFDQPTGTFVGATGIAKDVTELIRVERANVRLADAIEVLSGYFALYDEDDRLVISNARFREFNKEFRDAVRPGSKFEDLLRQEVAAGRYPAALGGQEESWVNERLTRRRETGGPFELEIAGGGWLYLDEERLPDGGTVMMARNITDLKCAMKALEESALHHREFAANVAHKLRTPLAVLRTSLDRLGNSEEIISLKREVDVFARMIEQLLTLTRYEHLVISGEMVADLRSVAVDVISGFAPIAIKEGRMLELEGAEEPVMVHGDVGALEHMIRNLVENAVKYSARGSSVRIILDQDPPAIHVVDQGRGIPPENREQLFSKFSRTDRRGAGAGLGLNVVKTIADAHGAEITVGNNAAGGAEFTLIFPIYDNDGNGSYSI